MLSGMTSSQRRPTLRDVTDHVICPLCQGYIIDATAVNSCLHLFCRTCLVRHLATSNGNGSCPKCGIQIKDESEDCIRRDHLMQRIIYKLIPHLLTRELQCRREFLKTSCDVSVTSSTPRDILPLDSQAMTGLYADSDDISICVRLIGGESCANASDELLRSRYLLCPANTTVGLVKKFIHSKFDLSIEKYQVEIFHAGQLLTSCSTLVDVAYSFEWDKTDPLLLDYIIVSCSTTQQSCKPDVAVVKSVNKNRKRKSDTSKSSSKDTGNEIKLTRTDHSRSKSSSHNTKETCDEPEAERTQTNSENVAENDDKLAGNDKDNNELSESTSSVGTVVADTSSDTTTKLISPITIRIPRPRNVIKRHPKKSKCRIKHRTSRKKQRSPTTPDKCVESEVSQHANTTSSPAVITPPSQPSAPAAASTAVSAAQTASASSVSRSAGCSDDDSCVSISTSVTVVISRRASGTAAVSSATTGSGNDVTVEAGSGTDSSRQFVVNTKIPKVSITTSTDIQQPKIALAAEQREPTTATPSGAGQSSPDDVEVVHEEVHKPTAASDALKRASQKRKSLESVIKALKPTAVVLATSSVSDDQQPQSVTSLAIADDVAGSSTPAVKHTPASAAESPSTTPVKDVDRAGHVIDLSVPTTRTSCGTSLVQDLRSDKRRSHHDDVARLPTVHNKTAASVVVPYVPSFSPSVGATFAVRRCTHLPSARCTLCVEDSLSMKYRFIPPGGALSYHRYGNNALRGDGYDTPLELTNKGK